MQGTTWSDKIGGRLNGWAEYYVRSTLKSRCSCLINSADALTRPLQTGSEAFWPVTGDFPDEMLKCARILRALTVDGIEQTVKAKSLDTGKKKEVKVIRKIPASVIADCKGLAIFTSMRSGIAPFGGAGGAGVICARLDDGSKSAYVTEREDSRR